MRLSLILPAFDEEKKILEDLKETESFLSRQEFSSEVIIVDDGSRDRTVEEVNRWISLQPKRKIEFRLISYPENEGKGYALVRGVKEARGEIIGFMDSGLCVPLKFILVALEAIEKGADCAIASRRLSGSRTVRKQPLHRRAGSKIFWKGMRLFMGIDVSDTQCGFKFYRSPAAKALFPRLRTKGFMFDIEALVLAKQWGMKTVEFPVDWANDADSRYHPVWGTFKNAKELLQIKIRGLRSFKRS